MLKLENGRRAHGRMGITMISLMDASSMAQTYASHNHMHNILQAAGIGKHVLQLIPGCVDSRR
eukprot:8717763-Prorocentrum_lima.AAC.1